MSHNEARPVIVVADDDEDILILVSFRLDRAGHEVLTARNGQEALDLICERHPDAAVLDVKMPKLTGIDVVKQVRELESVRDTPVILLSAGVQEDTIARGFEAGANDYIRSRSARMTLFSGSTKCSPAAELRSAALA